MAGFDDRKDEDAGQARQLFWSANWNLVHLYRKMNHLPQALDKLTVLLSLLQNDTNSLEAGQVYRAMGEIYQERGDGTNAAHFLEKSIQELKALPGSDTTRQEQEIDQGARSRQLCRTLLSMGLFLLDRGDLEQAEETLRESLAEAREQEGMDGLLAEAHLLLAQIHNRKSDLEGGLALNREALELAEQAGELHGITRSIRAICETHLAMGDHDPVSYTHLTLPTNREV